MADQLDEDVPTLKRKGSASPEAESATAKRFKVEGERSGETTYDADGTNDNDEKNKDMEMKEDKVAPQEDIIAEERPGTSPGRIKDEKEEGEQEEDDEMRDRSPRRSSISDHPKHAPAAPAASRRNFSLEEKKRGQRLFGGLLSTLNKSAPSTHQKKRQEIEKRQQERAQQQWVEDDKRRAEKLAKLTSVRKIEQVKFDEQVVCWAWKLHLHWCRPSQGVSYANRRLVDANATRQHARGGKQPPDEKRAQDREYLRRFPSHCGLPY